MATMTTTTTTATATTPPAGPLPSIKFYTNHRCPFAHRAHIALKELNLPYEEVLIDLDSPRPQWFLDVNPRGLVPVLDYADGAGGERALITESAVVAQFLVDARPSHLLPPAHASPAAPLFRARVNFFIDTFNTKVATWHYQILKLPDMPARRAKCDEWVAVFKAEVEPLLHDAAPFFGGSAELTYAEVIAAPFVVRMYDMCDDELFPASLATDMDALPNIRRWAAALRARESVTYIYDKAAVLDGVRKRMAKINATSK